MNIDNLTIGQVKEIVAMFGDNTCASSGLDSFAIGQHCIIRTYSAGVWCGKLEQKAGNEIILSNARRMWRWWCAESISLSGVVQYGINQEKSKIAAPVEKVWLEAIEIMPISGNPLNSIMEAAIVQAE